jgi:integrase
MPKLTKKLVESSLPKQKDYVVWDDEIKGFGCRILPSGHKTYVFHYTSPTTKKYSYLKIGVHGNYTVDLARDKAKKWCADIAQDIDPKEQKKAKAIEQKKSILFAEFWEIFTDKYIREHHKPSTIQGNKSRIKNKILPFFGAKKLADIERQDILAFKDSFSHVRGNCTKCLALLSPAFEQAELWGYRDRNSNPCKGVAKSPSRKMERFLSNGELETLEHVLADYATAGNASDYTVAAFRLLIYTGCRLGEVLTLKWEEVDLQNNCLRLKDSKTGARVIPLNDIAREVVLSIEKKKDNPYVFCGNKPGTHLVAVQKTWGRIRKKAGMPDLRIHDLRHSFASFAINNADLDLVHVQKLLGHKNIATTLRYAHLTDKKLLDSTNRIFKTQKEGTLNAA